jgi:EAL domain-containing protein (putative c-di-GMP-specific phosphodiesterase class I)
LIRMGKPGLGKDWVWLLGVALLLGVTLCIAAYAMGSGTTTVGMLCVALIALALSQALMTIRNHMQVAEIQGMAGSQQDYSGAIASIHEETRRLQAEGMNLARHVEQFRNDTALHNGGLAEGLAALRLGHEQVSENLKTIMDAQRDIQDNLMEAAKRQINTKALDHAIEREQQWLSQFETPDTAEPVAMQPDAVPEPVTAFEQSPLGDALTLALEPVVDLYTSSTAHYRMVLGMANEQGNDVPQDVFLHHAERMGLRPALDAHVVEQSLALLQQLRQRDANLCIFVPVGAVTLSSPDAIQDILTTLRNLPDLTQGIVLDVAHVVLASLSEASLEGLATLARGGILLSLSQASIAGVDLGALSRLNMRYVGITASSVGIGGVVSAGLPGFVQSARALRIQIVISHVGDPRHVNGLSRIARYASGPAFAVPRKLKRTSPDASTLSQAA